MSSQGGIDRRCMCVVDAVMHRPDQRTMVHPRGASEEMFAELNPRNRRLNRLKLPPNPRRSVRLHIPHVEMTRPTVQKQQNALIGSSLLPDMGFLRSQQTGQRDPRQAQRSQLQQMPSTQRQFRHSRTSRWTQYMVPLSSPPTRRTSMPVDAFRKLREKQQSTDEFTLHRQSELGVHSRRGADGVEAWLRYFYGLEALRLSLRSRLARGR